jgi:hypothetical protein
MPTLGPSGECRIVAQAHFGIVVHSSHTKATTLTSLNHETLQSPLRRMLPVIVQHYVARL